MLAILLGIIIGCGIGALLGYAAQSETGRRAFTLGRGAVYGGVLGAFVCFVTPCSVSGEQGKGGSAVRLVNESEFKAELANASTPMVVDFYADWCPPCRMLAPIVERQAVAFGGKIRFLKVDADRSEALALRYSVEGLPTLLFFSKGKLVDATAGLLTETELKAKLQKLSASAPNASPAEK